MRTPGRPGRPLAGREVPWEHPPWARPRRGGSPGPIPNPAVKPPIAESTAAQGRGRTGRRAHGGCFPFAGPPAGRPCGVCGAPGAQSPPGPCFLFPWFRTCLFSAGFRPVFFGRVYCQITRISWFSPAREESFVSERTQDVKSVADEALHDGSKLAELIEALSGGSRRDAPECGAGVGRGGEGASGRLGAVRHGTGGRAQPA